MTDHRDPGDEDDYRGPLEPGDAAYEAIHDALAATPSPTRRRERPPVDASLPSRLAGPHPATAIVLRAQLDALRQSRARAVRAWRARRRLTGDLADLTERLNDEALACLEWEGQCDRLKARVGRLEAVAAAARAWEAVMREGDVNHRWTYGELDAWHARRDEAEVALRAAVAALDAAAGEGEG